MNKRKFLKQAGAASVAAALVLASRSSQAQAPAGDVKILIVYHSITGIWKKWLKELPKVQTVSLAQASF
jgi:hypothetical protein